ncbi:MAG: hypothetical protein FD168_2073 [Desulfobulbaceae bacterium]|nr:MAG: hypothetical protein FD168_2073 [Desulfobulbaceae bacterium]
MKKVINTAIFAAVIAGAAVTAQAADIQVDMYGASAQRDYWKDLGQTFMTKTTAQGGMGCVSAHKAKKSSNQVVIKGETCTIAGGDDVYITYGSVASLEGVRAAKEVAPVVAEACATSNGNAFRTVVKVDSCTYPAWPAEGACTATVCSDIELGTSDVEGSSFDQSSKGGIYGHLGGSVVDIALAAETTAGLKNYKPTVVPFAFYANNDLGGATPAAPLNNLTRTQALNLFGGKVYDWGQLAGFGAYAGKGVQLCFRHAGSGTHATIDKAVMRGDIALVTEEAVNGLPGTLTDAFFYQSSDSTSGGMKQCIETNGGNGLAGDYIAIGYMDADALPTAAMHQLKYQGASAVDTDIANGSYDFWSAQNVYLKTSDDSAVVQKMMAFAAANIPSAKTGIWVKANDLKVVKGSDTAIPELQ